MCGTNSECADRVNESEPDVDIRPGRCHLNECSDVVDEGPCENPLCDDDVCRSSECVALVREARVVADARDGYDALLMPTKDRETTGAVLAALNRQGRIDTGDE